MLYYDRINLIEGIDVAESNNSEECIIWIILLFRIPIIMS